MHAERSVFAWIASALRHLFFIGFCPNIKSEHKKCLHITDIVSMPSVPQSDLRFAVLPSPYKNDPASSGEQTITKFKVRFLKSQLLVIDHSWAKVSFRAVHL